MVRIFTEQDGDTYYAYCPDLKGVHVGGDTEKEAIETCIDAIGSHLSTMIKHGDPIPVGLIESKRNVNIWKTLFGKIIDITKQKHSHVHELSLAT